MRFGNCRSDYKFWVIREGLIEKRKSNTGWGQKVGGKGKTGINRLQEGWKDPKWRPASTLVQIGFEFSLFVPGGLPRYSISDLMSSFIHYIVKDFYFLSLLGEIWKWTLQLFITNQGMYVSFLESHTWHYWNELHLCCLQRFILQT